MKDIEKKRFKNRQWAHERYAQRKRAGLCPTCGDIPEEGYVTCQKCRDTAKKYAIPYQVNRDFHREKGRQRYQKLKTQGLCAKCGKVPVKGHVFCVDCQSKKSKAQNERQYYKKRYDKLISQEICPRCNKNALVPGLKTCGFCCKKSREMWHEQSKQRILKLQQKKETWLKENNLEITNPELAREWHPSKNDTLTARDVSIKYPYKIWWLCKYNHDWKASIKKRIAGKICPVCKLRKVWKNNCLATVNPGLAKQWHPTKNENLTPKIVARKSNKKVWWLCEQGHEWQMKVNNRISLNCPYCRKSNQVNVFDQRL